MAKLIPIAAITFAFLLLREINPKLNAAADVNNIRYGIRKNANRSPKVISKTCINERIPKISDVIANPKPSPDCMERA